MTLASAIRAANEAEAKGELLPAKDAESTEAEAVGLTPEELAAAREAYLRMWPQGPAETR